MPPPQSQDPTADAAPTIRVAGNAGPEDLAAIVAVLAAAGGGGGATVEAPRSGWADHRRGVRRDAGHGPNAWRASGLPR